MSELTAQAASMAASMAACAALKYLRQQNVEVPNRPDLAASLRTALGEQITAALPGALEDAKEAVDCRMTDAALVTFSASMCIAGIEAAKQVMTQYGLH